MSITTSRASGTADVTIDEALCTVCAACVLGFPGYAMTYSKKLRAKWNLPKKTQQGIVVIFGHAEIQPVRALRRRFARIDTP